MKFYKKEALRFENGYLVTKKGKVVCVDTHIVELANQLEYKLQQAKYLHDQPKAVPAPNLTGFEFKSANKKVGHFSARTPIMDKKLEEAELLMDEIDGMMTADLMNAMAEEYADLIAFACSDKILDADYEAKQFDTNYLGDPRMWDEQTIVEAIAFINGFGMDDE